MYSHLSKINIQEEIEAKINKSGEILTPFGKINCLDCKNSQQECNSKKHFILIRPEDVNFVKNEGPEMSKFNLSVFLKSSKESFTKKLNPIYQAILKTRKRLNNEKSLICFIGAPWTLLFYMFNGKKNPNFIKLCLEIDSKIVKILV